MGGTTEWDALKKHHRFIRDDEQPGDVSWEERLARAYESKLFRDYALVDLKHYKSKRFALRWRTATEVVQGIGDETCGSLRCLYHNPQSDSQRSSRITQQLVPFELPFAYEEEGRRKETLVKVRLCPKCSAKLQWKPRNKDRTDERHRNDRDGYRRPKSRRSASPSDLHWRDTGRHRQVDSSSRQREASR